MRNKAPLRRASLSPLTCACGPKALLMCCSFEPREVKPSNARSCWQLAWIRSQLRCSHELRRRSGQRGRNPRKGWRVSPPRRRRRSHPRAKFPPPRHAVEVRASRATVVPKSGGAPTSALTLMRRPSADPLKSCIFRKSARDDAVSTPGPRQGARFSQRLCASLIPPVTTAGRGEHSPSSKLPPPSTVRHLSSVDAIHVVTRIPLALGSAWRLARSQLTTESVSRRSSSRRLCPVG